VQVGGEGEAVAVRGGGGRGWRGVGFLVGRFGRLAASIFLPSLQSIFSSSTGTALH
jgi:hypothetical protein